MQQEPRNITTEIITGKSVGAKLSLPELQGLLKPLVDRLRAYKERCLEDVAAAMAIAAEVGDILQRATQLELPGFDVRVWAEDNGLNASDATRYMEINLKLKKHNPDSLPMRQALVALELLPETSGRSAPPSDHKTPTFQLHINRLGQWFTEDRCKGMDQWVKENAIKQLEEIIGRLRAQ